MLKIKLTENYTGFEICGDYDELNFLYDSIHYLIKEEAETIEEEIMQNHIYGFLYDVRHAYQGDRDIELIDNELREEVREWKNIKKREVTDLNLYYKFNYLLPDLIEDIILIKHFKRKVIKEEIDIFNVYNNYVDLFYSLIIQELSSIVTKVQFKKIKKGLIESLINDRIFYPQWFELISVEYTKMSKEKRKKEIMHIVDSIYNYHTYIDYSEMKLDIKKMCEEKKCNLDDLHYSNYPEEIVW